MEKIGLNRECDVHRIQTIAEYLKNSFNIKGPIPAICLYNGGLIFFSAKSRILHIPLIDYYLKESNKGYLYYTNKDMIKISEIIDAIFDNSKNDSAIYKSNTEILQSLLESLSINYREYFTIKK